MHCAAALIAMTAFLSMPNVLRLGTLKEVSAPYVGFYKCETLRIGSKDFANEADARIEIDGEGQLTLTWKTLLGGEQSLTFPYEYDEKGQAFIVAVPDGKSQRKIKLSFIDGALTVSETLSGKALFAKFSRK